MILTDKCKIDFEKWYCKGFDRIASMLQLELFYSKSNIEKYTYYIEWFDSEKINIHTDINTECYIGKIYVTDLIHPDFTKKYYHNCGRKFVTNQLLSEANKIYNETSEVLYSQVATNLPASNSFEGCPFHYCDNTPVCESKCKYKN